MAATTAVAADTPQERADQQATTSAAESIEYLVKKLRAISSSSQKELENVNNYLSKLDVDQGQPLSAEQDDPIMAFDLENLKQAIRETVMLSGRYTAACKSMEHYLSNLETYCNGDKVAVDCTQDSTATSKSFPDEHEIKSSLKYVDRCISRCCAHMGEYGRKCRDLNDFLGDIIDKYCKVNLSPNLVEEHVYVFESICCPAVQLFGETDDQSSEKPPLYAKLAVFQNTWKLIVSVVEKSERIKQELLDLEKMEIDIQQDTLSSRGERSVASSHPEMNV